ncbi:NB-ARC domain protein (modular protein) [Desulfosarcina cetonica]|uniref:NB-ARC domain-containing protein n=1 Tax=Desulfosarcina cetonica TaxID=90730 RepID=UPI0006CF8677|nr:NB-ARC domain-containing protein [Desulfosarcina cetonica]VTR68692.1 NB-ARC domain protein (modular protein) [Desulfosarcina cetonica]
MTAGRKTDKRSQLAGRRFDLAVDLFTSSYEAIVNLNRWGSLVGYFELKQIRKWAKDGLPLKRVDQVAAFFGLEAQAFIDARIAEKDLINALYRAKPKVMEDGPDAIKPEHIEPAVEKEANTGGSKSPIPHPQYIGPPGEQIISIPSTPQIFLGRGSDIDNIKGLLNTGTNHQMIAIHGWPGVGKTTFAAALANDVAVQEGFPDGVIWMPMGVGFNPITGFSTLGQRHLLDSRELRQTTRLEAAISLLRDRIAGKRLLLLLDDAWEVDHVAGFRQSVGDTNVLIITTRSPEIARHLVYSADAVYRLNVFKEEDSMALLKILIPEVVEEYHSQCLALVNTLENLPLAIHVAGRMLRTENETWPDNVKALLDELIESIGSVFQERAPHDLFDPVKGELPTVKMLFEKSTDRLDNKTRICFALLSSFAPKPATFDLKRLTAAWAGIGVHDPKPVVTALANQGLLEPMKNGRFQMHALLLAHAENLLQGL